MELEGIRAPFMYSPTIFRAYDIRGIANQDFDPEFFRLLGERLAETKGGEVIVGCDARFDSEAYSHVLSKGVVGAGARAVAIGRVPIEVLYATVGLREGSSGAYLGASHNPAGWSGVKLMAPGVIPITGEDVEQWFSKSDSPPLPNRKIRKPASPAGRPASQVVHHNPWPGYILKVKELVGRLSLPRLKVVVDAGNGLGGLFFEHLPSLRQRLEIVPLFFEPDGRFPNHEPNPLKANNREAAKERLLKTKADLAVLFDGDADRVIFLDELGHFVPPDFIGALILEELIAGSGSAGDTSGVKGSHTPEVKEADRWTVVIDPRRGFAIGDAVLRLGGQVVVAKAGYPNIKAAMREHRAIFGVETSGHTYYRDFFSAESSLVTLLLVLKILARTNQKLSQLVHPLFREYFFIEEENIPLPKGSLEWIYRRVRTAFPGGTVSELDGLSIESPDWQLNLRPSNTEPLLRLNLEARSRARLNEIHSRLRSLLI